MIVVDTSALIAINFREPDADELAEKVLGQDSVMAAPSYLEAHLVHSRRAGAQAATELEESIRLLGIRVVPFAEEHAVLAASVFDRFGKGRHKAKLKFGDCISAALAKSFNCPLLYVGNDFALTDVPRA